MGAGRTRLQGVGRRPVDQSIREPIQGRGTTRGWGLNKHLGQCGGRVGCQGAPDARDERQRRHSRSGRTRRKEPTLFVLKHALSVRRKIFFADVPLHPGVLLVTKRKFSEP